MKNFLIAFTLPILFFFSGCETCPNERTTITAVTDPGVFLRQEAKGRVDELFEVTLAATYASIVDPYDGHAFVEGFLDRFSTNDFENDTPLRRYFPQYKGEKMEILAELQVALLQVHEANCIIVRQRMETWVGGCAELRNVEGSLKFEVKVPVDQGRKAERILQSSANIQFRETFQMQEVFPLLLAADSLYRIQVLGDTGKVVVEEDEEMTGGFDEMVGEMDGQGGRDALHEKMAEEFRALHPIVGKFNLEVALIPDNPIIGYAAAEDTAHISEMLAHPIVMGALPAGLKLCWSMKPESVGEEAVDLPALYAIKKPRLGSPADGLSGNQITYAHAEEEYGSWAVMVNMGKKGAQLFERLTKSNVNKAIAILIDDQVLSAPRVNSAITGGNIMISGHFTEDEAREMASLLTIGALLSPVNVVGVQ